MRAATNSHQRIITAAVCFMLFSRLSMLTTGMKKGGNGGNREDQGGKFNTYFSYN